MLTRRSVIAAKIESTYNTDATPSAVTDAFLVEDLSVKPAGARMVQPNPVRPSLAMVQALFAGTLMVATFKQRVKGAGAAYSASVRPEVDVPLRVCAAGVTIDATVSAEKATYKSVSDPSLHESGTFYAYKDGFLYKMTGCRGDADMANAVGENGFISFTITGHCTGVIDTALPTPTVDQVDPPSIVGLSVAIGGYAPVLSKYDFKLGNKIITPPDANASDGYGEIRITGRETLGSLDPEAVLVATHDFEAKWRAGTNMALTSGMIGGTQYNRFKYDHPAAYYKELSEGDRDGVLTYEAGIGMVESSGDDEWSLEFS